MAFFQLVLKARNLEKARQTYEDEKFTSIKISQGAKYRLTIKQRLRRRKLWFKKKVKNLFDRIFYFPKKSWPYKKYVDITTDGTLENYIAKSFFGFIAGIFLTYIFFIFFVFQLNFKLLSATLLCAVLGSILTIGLAFSLRVRCIVFLILPQFFSKRGRQALMAYAFILALTGPVKNTLHNTAVLSESLACAQEQLKEAVKTVIDLAKQPYYALREAISKVIKTVKVVVKKIKQTLIAIKRIVLSILKVITSVFQWLGSVINICNKKLGTPFDRCQNVFEGAVADCKAKLGPIFGVVCDITYVVSTLCYIVKPLDFICMLVSYIADTVVGTVRNKIKQFTMHMKAMFYVKVKFSHSFQYETNQSKTIEQVSTGIAAEIRSRTNALFGFFNWMSFVTSLFFILILLRALRYRYKWLTSERFDNRYITNDLRTIDLIRAKQDKETVLPLNLREQNKYVPLSSVMLLKSEKIKLSRSIVFLGLATMKLAAYMTIDYSLYWVLNIIQIHGRFESKVDQPNVVTIHVAGDGYLAQLYKSIANAFTPHGKETEVDTMLCLPDPIHPNLDKYVQIVVLIFFCWLIMFFEPYGLRLRHVVLCQYYPARAKQRAAWLYNHIIRSRGSFLKFARRQLRRKFGISNGERIEKVTIKEKVWAMFPWLKILFSMKQNMCLLCGAVERSDDNRHIKCPTPGCVGLFCTQCFADLQNLCTICRSPIEYGDLTDMSEERDSSDDQFEIQKMTLPKPDVKEEEPEFGEEEETEWEQEGEEDTDWKEGEESDWEMEEEEESEWEEEGREEQEWKDEGEEETEWQEEKPEWEMEEETSLEEQEERDRKIVRGKMKEQMRTEPRISKGKEHGKFMKKEKDVAEEMVKKDSDVLDRSSESDYSYTYQDESPEELEIEERREPFKDVEAQKIRDDVSTQIFNEPLARESLSSSESPTSSLDTRVGRKVGAKLKKRPSDRVPGVKDSDSSTSIADTESWSTEEVDEEEMVHVETDDDAEKLLPKDRKDKAKLGRINRFVGAVAKIPWLGKGEDGEKERRSLRKSRPSLMNRIASMLQRKQSSELPKESYRKKRASEDTSSSSSYSREEKSFLKTSEDESRYLIRRKSGSVAKQLPKHLESTAKDTRYFEEDETGSSRPRKYIRQVKDINELSDMGTFTGAKKRSTRDVENDDELGTRRRPMVPFQATEDEDTFSYKGYRDKRPSRKRKCGCSSKSTLSDEEPYAYEYKSKPKGLEEKWDSHEFIYSAEECQCYPQNCDPDVCLSSAFETPRETATSRRSEVSTEQFQMPVIRKYLPMYQSPELIDELKRHDRIRSIRQEQAKRRSSEKAPRSRAPISERSKRDDRKREHRNVRSFSEDDRLPRREIEMKKKTKRRRSHEKEADDVPLITLSKRADKSKNVKQLYARQEKTGSKSGVVKQLKQKIVAPFKSAKKHKYKDHTEMIRIEETECSCSYNPEIASDMSSTCNCIQKVQEFDTSNTADEKTDNE